MIVTGAGPGPRPLAAARGGAAGGRAVGVAAATGTHLASTDPGGILAVLDQTRVQGVQEEAEVEQSVSAGGGEGVTEPAAERAVPEEPAGVEEPVLGGPKDDPQEAIATHSGMWWPPAIEPETGEAPEAPAGTDAGGESPPAQPAEP